MLKLNCAAASESESATFTAGMTGKNRCTASGAMNATRPSARAKARPGTWRGNFSTAVKRLTYGARWHGHSSLCGRNILQRAGPRLNAPSRHNDDLDEHQPRHEPDHA